MSNDPIEQFLANPLAGSLLIYLCVCLFLFAVYKWNKNLERFAANVFIVTACWAAGIALTPALGDMRWFAVAIQIVFAVFLMIYSRRMLHKKMKSTTKGLGSNGINN